MTFSLNSDIDRWTGRISTNATSRNRHDGVRDTPEPSRSGRRDARRGRGGAGTLPRTGEVQVREDLSDDHGIVQRDESIGDIRAIVSHG